MLRKSLTLAALLMCLVLALSFTGRVHPLGDSLAVFRLPSLGLCALFVLALRKYRIFIAALALIGLSAASMALYYIPQNIETEGAIKLYQKNLLYTLKDSAKIKADILESRTDLITLQEVQLENTVFSNLALLDELETNYPHQHFCPLAHIGGVAMLSRWPILESHCYNNDGIGAVQVQSPQGPLWIISAHLYWPYPHGQRPQLERAFGHIQSLEGPKIIAGDFNMVPWSYVLNALERASGSKVARPITHSFDLPIIGLRIPIDHVLLPKGAKSKTERRGKLGSDHYGLLVSFTLP